MKINEIIIATGGTLISGLLSDRLIKGVSIDSRTIKKNELFIAVKGTRFDGHDFIKEAVRKGANSIVSNRRISHKLDAPLVIVPDTVKALGDIAAYQRRKFDIPVIGVTGSNGKTTAKEIIAHILSAKFNVLKNKGTENNFIGVPLTLLRLNKTHGAAVIEIGANHTGEIRRLTEVLKPTLGLITNIGPSHLQYFGDLDTILKAKSEIIDYLMPGSIVLNGDDEYLMRLKARTKALTFGIEKKNDFRARDIRQNNKSIEFIVDKTRFTLNLLGRHNIYNALAGIAIASILDIDTKTIKKRLTTFKSLPMRMKVHTVNGFHIIDDSYNSNPVSSRCAVDFLSSFGTKKRKIFVTGDMLELGAHSRYFHRELGKLIASYGIDRLIAVGALSKETAYAAKRAGMENSAVWICPSSNKAASVLARIIRPGDTVLVKGSRAVKMEKIIEKFRCVSLRASRRRAKQSQLEIASSALRASSQ